MGPQSTLKTDLVATWKHGLNNTFSSRLQLKSQRYYCHWAMQNIYTADCDVSTLHPPLLSNVSVSLERPNKAGHVVWDTGLMDGCIECFMLLMWLLIYHPILNQILFALLVTVLFLLYLSLLYLEDGVQHCRLSSMLFVLTCAVTLFV